jgi:hypothetical protein
MSVYGMLCSVGEWRQRCFLTGVSRLTGGLQVQHLMDWLVNIEFFVTNAKSDRARREICRALR